uniref:C-type lectin domain-containing protein n=1 Tax=Acrobeloides nanus TaxID=290746 RepID=A0A914CNR9_9BILA
MAVPPPCGGGTGFVQSNVTQNKFYCVPDMHANYFDASVECVSKTVTNFMGSLVSIDNVFENGDITALLRTLSNTPLQFFIGLHYEGAKRGWEWTNGDKQNYTNWSAGYPVLDKEANCVTLIKTTGTWANTYCDDNRVLTFICEMIYTGS